MNEGPPITDLLDPESTPLPVPASRVEWIGDPPQLWTGTGTPTPRRPRGGGARRMRQTRSTTRAAWRTPSIVIALVATAAAITIIGVLSALALLFS